MPKIFNDEERTILHDKLLQTGIQLLEKKSYRNISIDEIAINVGIAKGTFYNFFSSKEIFFYEVMLFIRNENRKEMMGFFQCTPLDRYQIAEYLYNRYTETKTIYYYFSLEDLKIIFRKLPEQLKEAENDSYELAKQLTSLIIKTNPDFHVEVLVNLLNVVATVSANNKLIAPNYFHETIRVLTTSITNYIFREEGSK